MSDEEGNTNIGQETQEEEGTGAKQETPVATETTDVSKPDKPATELKVVIILKADRAMLGVQSPDCDPVYKTMEGDLAAVLQVVPTLVLEFMYRLLNKKLTWMGAYLDLDAGTLQTVPA